MSARDHAIEQYIARRFEAGTLRSREYQTGFGLGLRLGLDGDLGRTPTSQTPYTVGTCAADAFFSGFAEGQRRAENETTEHLRRSPS